MLFGLAEAYERLGDRANADAKLHEIEKTWAGTAYASEARRWLVTTPSSASNLHHT